MKLGRTHVGRMAEIRWRDPFRVTLERCKADLTDVAINESVFPRQKERGVIVAVREGIVVICHTETEDSPLKPGDTMPEYDCTFVPEDRIESVTLYLPEPNGGGGTPS